MDNVYLFNAKLYKYGTEEIIEECQIMAFNLFMANHILMEYIYGEDNKFKTPVEIGLIEKIRVVTNVINPDFVSMIEDISDEDEEINELGNIQQRNYKGDIPLKIAENMTDDMTITFSCECHEQLRIPAQLGFPYVTCSNCGLEIKPIEIKNAGGIYYYQKVENKK